MVKAPSILVLCYPISLLHFIFNMCEEEREELHIKQNGSCSYFISKNLIEWPYMTAKEAMVSS